MCARGIQDEGDWELNYQRFRRELAELARRLAPPVESVADVVSDAVFKLTRALSSGTSIGSRRAYARRCVVTICYDQRRRRKSRREVPLGNMDLFPAPSARDGDAEQVDQRRTRLLVELRRLTKLSPSQEKLLHRVLAGVPTITALEVCEGVSPRATQERFRRLEKRMRRS